MIEEKKESSTHLISDRCVLLCGYQPFHQSVIFFSQFIRIFLIRFFHKMR